MGKTISKIAKQEEMIKKWNLNKNIQKELLKDLAVKKIKRNLKLNKKDFTSHFTKDITKYRKRKPKIILEKVQGSNQILAFLKFELLFFLPFFQSNFPVLDRYQHLLHDTCVSFGMAFHSQAVDQQLLSPNHFLTKLQIRQAWQKENC